MRFRLFTFVLAILVAASALAEKPIRRTLVIKDGKVITDTTEGGLADSLIGGKRTYLGVSTLDLTPELREHFGAAQETGVLVSSVEEQSPAARAGVRAGDILVAIDGRGVKSASELRGTIRDHRNGDAVRIEVLRGRNRLVLLATLAEREGPRVLIPAEIEELTSRLGSSPEWRARVEAFGGDCNELRGRIRDLESRLKDLEKKLQK
jgi:predicted metalloprotease with PDZ domain